MSMQSTNYKQLYPNLARAAAVIAALVAGLWLNTPSVFASPQNGPSAQGSTELKMFDWNQDVTTAQNGFPNIEPSGSSPVNGDWTTPVNFAEGTLYFRAEIRNQPEVQDDMLLQFCIWQTSPTGERFALETCSTKATVAGYSGNVVTWDQEIDNMWKLDGNPIDWARARQRYAAVIKRPKAAGDDPLWGGGDPPVSGFNIFDSEGNMIGNFSWAGEDPADWYPLDMRFTVVVVAKDETFSGWGNYVTTGPDNNPPVLLSHSPADGSNTVAQNTNITVNLVDFPSGVDTSTIELGITTSTAPSSTMTIPFNDLIITGDDTNPEVVYEPTSNFDLNEVVTVTVNAEDKQDNVMAEESFSFTVTLEPDTTPPVISNLVCQPSANQITIQWTTDEPATSSVDYGKTNGLELGTKSNGNLKTDHELVITGLSPQTTYYYEASSRDANNNETISDLETCATIGPSSLQGDDFNYCTLDTNRWSWIDPQSGEAGASSREDTGQTIEISVPGGISHDVYNNGIDAAHVAQFVNDTDFEFDIKFDSEVLEQNQMQGVLIKQDNNNFLRIDFRNTDGTQQKYEAFEVAVGQSVSNSFQGSAGNEGDGPMYLRVRRLGNNYTVWISRSGVFSGNGRTITSQNSLIVSSIAIFAGNAAPNPAFTSVVDYFFRTDSPITPEDGTALEVGLAVSPVETGTVSKNISCGNPLELTADPIPGWSFVEWTSIQGSVMTSTNPIEVAFPYNEVITANFAQNFYEVSAVVNDGMDGATGGTVMVSSPPTEQGYEYNQLVSVTAAATEGWKFDGWEGALSSSTLTETLVITESKFLTATFSQIPYTITVTVDGGGAVASDPEAGPYYLNESVNMTATPSAGWTFIGWAGDLTGTNVSEVLTIDGDKAVMALFAQDQYTLTVQTNGSGTGSVAISPENDSYIFGNTVTLTSTAAPGSTLVGWSGAGLSGDDESVGITMTQSESVVATFARDYYTVTAGAAVGGQISLSSPTQTEGYIYNEVIIAEAEPALGYVFQNWTGALSSVSATEVLTVTGNQAVGAEFALEYYQVDVTHNEGGSVNVTTPASSQGYIYNESVVVTAVPDAGYEFDGWSGSYGDNPTVVVTIAGDVAIEATFKKLGAKSFVLSYESGEGGSITLDPVRDGGIYIEDTVVTLTAVAEDGYGFSNWTDGVGNILGLDPVGFEVIMNDDKTVKANFIEGSYTASTSVVGNGVVNMSPLPGSQGYSYGTNIMLTATPDSGWAFSGWEDAGGLTMSTNPLTLTIKSNVVYTATFVEVDNTVTGMSIATDGKGDIETTPNKAVYEDGEEITLTANANQGWRFVGWEVDAPLVSGEKTDRTIVVAAQNDLDVKALFEEIGFGIYLPFVY